MENVVLEDLETELASELESIFCIFTPEDIDVFNTWPFSFEIEVKVEDVPECVVKMEIVCPTTYLTEEADPLLVTCHVICKDYFSSKEEQDLMKAELVEYIQTLYEEQEPQIFEAISFVQQWIENQSDAKGKKGARANIETVCRSISKSYLYNVKSYSPYSLQCMLFKKIEKTMISNSIQFNEALSLLQKNCWNLDKTTLARPIFKKASSFEEVSLLQPTEETFTCQICFDDEPVNTGVALSCAHFACKECWIGYMENQLRSGVLVPKCPGFKCKEVIPRALINALISPEAVELSKTRMVTHYADTSQSCIYCPISPTCETIIHLNGHCTDREQPYLVCSQCEVLFCGKCHKDPHWPVPCDQVDNVISILGSKYSADQNMDFFSNDSVFPLYKSTMANLTKDLHIICEETGNTLNLEDLDVIEDTFVSNPDMSWAAPFVRKILNQVPNDFKEYLKRPITANALISYFNEHLEFVKENVRATVVTRGLEEHGPILVDLSIIEQMIQDVFFDLSRRYNAKGCYQRYNFPQSFPCPQCGVGFQKDGGCQYMTCPLCNCHYCFECMQRLNASHAEHNCKPIGSKGRDKLRNAAIGNAKHTYGGGETTELAQTMEICLDDLKIYNGIKANLYYILQEDKRARSVAKKAGGGCKYEDIQFLLNRIFHTIDLAIWILKFLIWQKISHVKHPDIFRLAGFVRDELQRFGCLLQDRVCIRGSRLKTLNAKNLIRFNETTTICVKNLIVCFCAQVEDIDIPKQLEDLVNKLRNGRKKKEETSFQLGDYRMLKQTYATRTESSTSELVNNINVNDVVTIVEIKKMDEENRIRGRIATDPPEWITLHNTKSEKYFAELACNEAWKQWIRRERYRKNFLTDKEVPIERVIARIENDIATSAKKNKTSKKSAKKSAAILIKSDDGGTKI